MDDTFLHMSVGGRTRCTPRWARPQGVFADDHRLYFPRQGKAQIAWGNQRWDLLPHRVYLIPGRRKIYQFCQDEMELDWLHFRVQALEADATLVRLAGVKVWPEAMWRRWEATFGQIQTYFRHRTYESDMRLKAMAMELLAQCIGPAMDQRAGARGSPWHLRLRPAVEVMNETYTTHPTLEQIAESVHLSPAYFQRRFRETFDVTPHDYMHRLRMRKAREMLRSDRYNVTEAAEALGYANVFYFSRVFKQYHGYTPSQAPGADDSPMP